LNINCPIYLPLQDKLQGIQLFFGSSRIVNITLPHILRLSGNQKNSRSCRAFYNENVECGWRLRAAKPIVAGSCAAWHWEVAINIKWHVSHYKITPQVPRVSRMWLIIIAKANSSWGLSEQAMTFVFCNTPACLFL